MRTFAKPENAKVSNMLSVSESVGFKIGIFLEVPCKDLIAWDSVYTILFSQTFSCETLPIGRCIQNYGSLV